jgi:hypothetical protein
MISSVCSFPRLPGRTRLILSTNLQCLPVKSTGRYRGFYNAFGVEPCRTNPERADHITLELEFMSWLILKETRACEIRGQDSADAQVCREAQQRFLTEHLLWWAPALGFAMRKKADHITVESELVSPPKSFYGATAQFLAAFMRQNGSCLAFIRRNASFHPTPASKTEPSLCEGLSCRPRNSFPVRVHLITARCVSDQD